MSDHPTHDEDVRVWMRCHFTMADDTECVRATDDDDGPGCGKCQEQTLSLIDALVREHEAATAMVRPRDALLAWSKDKVTLRTEPWEALTAAHDEVERMK